MHARHRDLHPVVAGIEPRIALVRVEHGREHHPVELLVLRVAVVVDHVAEVRVRHPGQDPLDEVVLVDGAVDAEPAQRRERHDGQRAPLEHQSGRRGVVGRCRRLQEPVRRHPDVELADLGVGRLRHGVVPGQRPGVLAEGEEDALLLSLQRRAAAQRGIVALAARIHLVRRAMVVTDGAIVGSDLEPGPVVGRRVALTDVRDPPRSGVADGAHLAHRLGGGLQHLFDVLGRGRRRQRARHHENSQRSAHRFPPRNLQMSVEPDDSPPSETPTRARRLLARPCGSRATLWSWEPRRESRWRDLPRRPRDPHAGARAYNPRIDRH